MLAGHPFRFSCRNENGPTASPSECVEPDSNRENASLVLWAANPVLLLRSLRPLSAWDRIWTTPENLRPRRRFSDCFEPTDSYGTAS
jgi:hypothetical protein